MKVNKMSRATYNSKKKNKSRMKHKKRTKSKSKTKIMNKMKGGAANVVKPSLSILPSGMPFRLATNNEKKKLKELEEKKRKIEEELDKLNKEMKEMKLNPFKLFEVTNAFVQLIYYVDDYPNHWKLYNPKKISNENSKKLLKNFSLSRKSTYQSNRKSTNKSQRENTYKSNEYPLAFTILPDELSVDKLQYFINNSNISIHEKKYISFNENTVVLRCSKAAGQKRIGGKGKENEFIDIYEEKKVGNSQIISYEENLYNCLGNFNPDEKDMTAFFNNEGGRFLINLYSGTNPGRYQVKEDVSWLKFIIDDLNAINTKENSKTNLKYFLELNLITTETKIFSCNDLNVDHTKLIIDDGGNNKLLSDGEEYVIVGYPAEKMRSYLDLYKKHEDDFKGIYDDHKAHFMEYMAQLHNGIYDNLAKPDPLKHINTDNEESLKTEIHKFYDYEKYYRYIEDFYKNAFTPEDKKPQNGEYPINAEYGIPYDSDFQGKIKELQEAFYNELASKCLNKPMMKINYVFLIYKKYEKEGKYKNMYVPAVFNIRELQHKHHTILKRLEYLIKTILSQIYGITDEIKEDYKLWYSHYNYGDVFHIKTEYVHTMSNIQQQAYKYKNSISLEELIYMLSIPKVDLINLRIDYQRKPINFTVINNVEQTTQFEERLKNFKDLKEADPVYKIFLEEDKELDVELSKFKSSTNKILLIFTETGKIYTIIYKDVYNNFYKLKIKPNLTECIPQIFKYLQSTNDVSGVNQFNLLKDKLYAKKDIEHLESIDIPKEKIIKLYEVLEHRPITQDDYNTIMRYNPLISRQINIKSTENILDIKYFFQTLHIDNNFFNNFPAISIPNPYLKKPFIIRNILSTKIYIDNFEIFKNNLQIGKNEHNYRSNKDKKLLNTLDNKYIYSFYEQNNIIINCIYFNPNNCGYNFIEIYEKLINGFKSVLWIVPIYSTHSSIINEINEDDTIFNKYYKYKYLGNFLYLNENHFEMLNQIKELYLTQNTFCNLNILSNSPPYFCLHFQITNNEQYQSTFAHFEQGTRLKAMLNLNTAFNNLNLNNKYYNEFNVEIILHNDN